jgi:hypothetical protein
MFFFQVRISHVYVLAFVTYLLTLPRTLLNVEPAVVRCLEECRPALADIAACCRAGLPMPCHEHSSIRAVSVTQCKPDFSTCYL